MSVRFASEQLADLRHHAQLLIERAGDQEGQLEALVAGTEGDVRQAEAAVSHAADDLDVGDVRHLLSGQLGFLVRTASNGLEVGPELLKEYCARLLDSAACGSLLVGAVEDMPPTVRDADRSARWT